MSACVSVSQIRKVVVSRPIPTITAHSSSCRWGTIPVVRAAQLEKEVNLPIELVEPWEYLQRYFGCASQSGNNTSSLVLNFDEKGRYVYKINEGLSESVTTSEEAFARIFYEVEILVCCRILVSLPGHKLS
jgi:hypothetical protein